MSSCLADTINPEAIALAEIDKQREQISIRDQTFTKEDIKRLKKHTWIEVKDLIFETEPKILEYLSFHCRRWRKTMKG